MVSKSRKDFNHSVEVLSRNVIKISIAGVDAYHLEIVRA